jgi:hypothetical protein
MPAFSRPLLNMLDSVYRIRNWPEHFETAESRKIKGALSWVAIPTKHDGRGYKRAARQRHGVEALCGWWSMLQVAAKMPVHGLLADRDGPLDADDIADKTNLPAKIYITALEVMSSDKIGWLEKLPWNPNLDFAGNIAALIAAQHLPAGALAHQRTPAASSRPQRTHKLQPSPANPSGDQQPPAQNSSSPAAPAETSGNQRSPAETSLHNITGHNRTIPLPSPEGGQGGLNFDRAKEFLSAVFNREKRKWSREEDGLLADIVPIPAADATLIGLWFRLAEDHPVFEKTKRKQELTTYLRDYQGENDKMRRFAPLFAAGLNGANGAKKEPAGWRQTLRWIHGGEIHLPPTYAELGVDLRKEYEANCDAFLKSPTHMAQQALGGGGL